MRYEALFTLKGRFYGGEFGHTRANGCECAGEIFPVIVIHGGTSGLDLTKEEFKIREEPMKKALLAGQAVLEKGGSAMDAVTAAIMVLV